MTHATTTPRALLSLTAGLVLLLAACAAPAGQGSVAPSAAAPDSTPGASAGSVEPSVAGSPAPTTAASRGPAGPLDSDPLHALVLTDVRTGQQVLLGQLAAEKPLLLETMAIWCTNCRAQQHQVRAAHVQADFHSVSLDVDPGEQPDDLARYADREDFDWHFAMADADLLARLRERFGTAVVVPPSMPKILFRTDGSIEMIGLGELYSAEQIIAALGG